MASLEMPEWFGQLSVWLGFGSDHELTGFWVQTPHWALH